MVVKFNFLSKYLGMQTNVTMCLPSFSFADVMSDRKEVYVQGMKYQTLYLLHGGSGDDSDYVNFSNIVRYADDHKLAVVMPCDYNGGYTDVPKGPKYLKYIMEELIPLTRAFFPLSDKREDTFVGGLSMGAAGAMKIALTYPELFSAALVMSGGAKHPDTLKPDSPLALPGLSMKRRSDDPDAMPMPNLSKIHGTWEEFVGSKHNAFLAAENDVKEGKPLPEFFFACGQDDFALPTCRLGYEELKKLGFKASMLELPGYKHEWDFWDLILRKAIGEWLPIRHSAIYPGE